VECLNVVYGTMVVALLYYKKFVKSLVNHNFKLNPYNGCVANKIVKGSKLLCAFMLMTARSPMSIQKWLMRLSTSSVFGNDFGLFTQRTVYCYYA
jgi:hypothetical protein